MNAETVKQAVDQTKHTSVFFFFLVYDKNDIFCDNMYSFSIYLYTYLYIFSINRCYIKYLNKNKHLG